MYQNPCEGTHCNMFGIGENCRACYNSCAMAEESFHEEGVRLVWLVRRLELFSCAPMSGTLGIALGSPVAPRPNTISPERIVELFRRQAWLIIHLCVKVTRT